MSSKNLEIRNNKMLHIPVIPILKAHEIFLLKNADVQARPIVQSENGGRIFDDEHKLSLAMVDEIVCEALLVPHRKLVLSVCAELAIVGRI